MRFNFGVRASASGWALSSELSRPGTGDGMKGVGEFDMERDMERGKYESTKVRKCGKYEMDDGDWVSRLGDDDWVSLNVRFVKGALYRLR